MATSKLELCLIYTEFHDWFNFMLKRITIVSVHNFFKKREKYNKGTILLGKDILKHIDIDKLSSDYINFIADLNKRNNSLIWWSGSIASKNQFVSGLFRNICKLFQFIDVVENFNAKEVTFLIDDKSLLKQIKFYCKQKNIKIILKDSKIKKIFHFFVKIKQFKKNNLYFLISGWIKKYMVDRNLKGLIEQKLDKKNSYYILRTLIDNRSFDSRNRFCDFPFGRLVTYLRDKKKTILLAKVLSDFKGNILKIKNNISNELIIPQEYFVSYFDYIRIMFMPFKKYFRFPKEIKFNGQNIKYLIEGENRDNLISGEFAQNLFCFYVVKNLLKRIRCETFAFTYENHAWEKMTVMALREYSENTFVIGYQHSSICQKHFNYFLGKNEIAIIPLPDKIITAGSESKQILEKYGNYSSNLLKEGCALRYAYLYKTEMQPRKINHKILSVLSIDLQDSINLLAFLLRAFDKNKSFHILIKCHPLMPIKKILSKSKLKLPQHFEVINDKGIKDLVAEADILLYMQTTVCLEALMMGIPVIYADIDNFYDCDALFGCNYLKWKVRHEESLIKTINEIYNLNTTEFRKQQILGRKYVENYFMPVEDERMEEFVKR